MPKNRRKSGKRNRLRQFFGKCTSPETSSPDIDNATQNCQEISDIVEEELATPVVEDIATVKSYSVEYVKSIPEYDTDVAEQNRSHGYITIIPQEKVSTGENRYGSNKYDKRNVEHRPFDVSQRRSTSAFADMEITCNEDDSTSIGACSLSPVGIDEQMDTTANKEDDNTSIGNCSGSPLGIDERDKTTNNEDDNTSIGACSGSSVGKDEQNDTTANKEDDNISIGACSLSYIEEQIIEKHNVVSDDGENSNDSGKQKDVDYTANTSSKTVSYIDPMVMDSQRQILLNMKNLIEQNLKKIKDMRKQKAHLNITVQKAELKLDRAKKSNNEMSVKIISLRADFWEEARKFPAAVSIKRDKFDNIKAKRKQDLVDLLNTMKRKEKLLKEVIPKLTKENTLKRSWSLTVPAITLSPVIEQLNVQFEAEFGTRFEIKELKPGIYIRHPFTRKTHHIPEEKIEEFKIKQPHLYYNCQCFIKRNDVGKIDQQIEEVNLYNEKKLYQVESEEKDGDKQSSDIDNDLNKRKTLSNGTSSIIKHSDVIKMKNKQENTMVDDCSTSLQTKMSVTKADEKTPRKEKKYSTDKIVQTKNQTPSRGTREPIVGSKVKIGKAKNQKMVNLTISKPGSSSNVDKIRTDTSRCSKEIAENDNEKKKKEQENIIEDKEMLERVEKLREQGKDVYIKTTGSKSFIYLKHAVSQAPATGSDLIKNKNGNFATCDTKRSKPQTDIMVFQRPPSAPITYAAVKSIPATYNSNSKNISRWIRVYTKPEAVNGKTKIPLYIRQNMANKTPTPRRQPNSNVPPPHIHLEKGQSNHGVIQKKSKFCGSDSIVTDALNYEAIVDRDKYNMAQKIPKIPQKSKAENVQMSLKPTSKPPKVYQKSLKSLIPISIHYMKERNQSSDLYRKQTPYDNIIAQVINEHFPLDIEENNALDNLEVIENKPENNHHFISRRDNEKSKSKGKIKSKNKVENRKGLLLQESDNVIMKTPRNMVILPPIKPASSPTKRARTRTERCKSNKKNNKDYNDSLCVNEGSTMNVRNPVSVTVPHNSAADDRLSDKLLKKTNSNFLPRLQGTKDEKNEMVPHPPELPKDGSNRRIRRNVRTPESIKIGSMDSKFSNKINRPSVEAFKQRIQYTANDDDHSFDETSSICGTIY